MSVSKKDKQLLETKEGQTIVSSQDRIEILEKHIDKLLADLKDPNLKLTKEERKEMKSQVGYARSQLSMDMATRDHAIDKLFPGNTMDAQGKEDEAKSLAAAANDLEKTSKNIEKTTQKWSKGIDGISKIINAAVKLYTIGRQKDFENIAAAFDIEMADIQAKGKTATLAADLQTNAYTSAVTSSLGAWTGGINEAAYASASKLIDLKAQSMKFPLEKEQIDLIAKNTKNVRSAQNEATISNLTAQQGQTVASGIGGVLNTAAIAAKDPKVKVGAMVGGAVVQGVSDAWASIVQTENQFKVQEQEQIKQRSETLKGYGLDIKKKWIDAGAEVMKAWLDFAQKTEEKFSKAEVASNDMGVGLGYSGKQLENYKKSMYDTQVAISVFGKDMEDAQNLQNSYTEATGRNIQLSTDDMLSSFAMDKLMGKDGASVELTAAMEPFKHSVADSNAMFGEMFDRANKIGISGRKYLKDLTKNLKLAEKYQFKGGTKGLAEMAMWAQNVRFNMNSLGGMLDKIQTGGLSGIIEQAASLQVLGGNFAMGSDPLAMAYESYMDPQGLAKRMNGMLQGLGVLNSETGEVEFGISSQIRMREMANASGQSYEDVMNQARQIAYGDTISRNLSGNHNWTEDQKALVTNKAQKNKNGEWVVTMADNTEKEVSDLTPDDLKNLMPEGDEEVGEKLVEHTAKLLDVVTKMEAEEKKRDALLTKGIRKEAINQMETRIQNMDTDLGNIEEYVGNVKDMMKFATESQKTLRQMMEAGNTNAESTSNEILKEGNNIKESLADVNKILKEALKEMGFDENGNEINDNKSDTNGGKDKSKEEKSTWDKINGWEGWDKITTVGLSAAEGAGLGAAMGAAGGVTIAPAALIGGIVGGVKGLFDAFWGGDSAKDGIISPSGSLSRISDGAISQSGYAKSLNDGLVVQNGIPTQIDQNDQVMAAKNGGPIDKMVNVLYDSYANPESYVKRVYDAFASQTVYDKDSNEMGFGIASQMRMRQYAESTGQRYEDVLSDVKNSATPRPMPYDSFVKESPNSGGGSIQSVRVEIPPLQINFNGSMRLNCDNGSVDIMELMEKDPNFIRSLSQRLTQEIEKQLQGGRSRDPYRP